MDIASYRDAELEWAVQARLGAETEFEVARATMATAEAKALEDTVVARTEAAKKSEKDFGTCFFQGYSDEKKRVALIHPKWDVSGFSGIESDYWKVETPTTTEEVERIDTSPTKRAKET